MILIPSDASDRAKIIGIDPGSEKLGVAYIEFSCTDFSIYKCGALTLIGSKLPRGDFDIMLHSDRFSRINALKEELYRILVEERPLVVSSEAPFINVRRPAAYGALVEVVSHVRQAVREYSGWNKLLLVSPSSTKQAVGAPGNADKDKVKSCILKIPELVNYCESNIENLDEHSLDALAVAYHTLTQYRKSEFPRLELF